MDLKIGAPSNPHYSLLIHSFQEIHRQTCPNDDCPLKNSKSNKNIINRINKTLNLDNTEDSIFL